MGVKAELAGFLAHLPGVDGPDERKALLTFTGLSELGIYLDWQGSNVAFTERLLEELSRRGKGTLSSFLAGLPNTPQVANSVERQQQLAALRDEVDVLDEASFRAEFPVPLPIGVAAPRPPADPVMLAAAVVNEVLAPYYKLGADQLRQRADRRAVTLAESMAEKVETALASDLAADALFTVFKQNPELGQAGLLGVLRARLTGDPALVGELAELFSAAAAEPEAGGVQALVDVSHEIGLVRGDVVGAVVGADVLDKIQRVSVKQEIDTVDKGGAVVGAVVGGSGPVNIVGGDKITIGDVTDSTLAVGREVQIHVQQAMSAADFATAFQAVFRQIEARPVDPEADRDEIQDIAQRVKDEVVKGDTASEKKVERWLNLLIDIAPDVAEVALAALTNPVAGVAAAISKLAQRLKAGLA